MNIIIKTFEVEGTKYSLVKPSVSVLREAKYRYSKSFTDAINKGFYTKKKLEMTLRSGEFNIIEDHSTRRASLLSKFIDAQKDAGNAKSPEELEYCAELLHIYRESLTQEDMSLNAIYENTADKMADDERMSFLIFSLIRDDKDAPIWKDFDTFLAETRFELVEACKYQVMCWEYGLNPDWQNKLPEHEIRQKATDLREKQASQQLEDLTKQTNSILQESPSTVTLDVQVKTKVKSKKSKKIKKSEADTKGAPLVS